MHLLHLNTRCWKVIENGLEYFVLSVLRKKTNADVFSRRLCCELGKSGCLAVSVDADRQCSDCDVTVVLRFMRETLTTTSVYSLYANCSGPTPVMSRSVFRTAKCSTTTTTTTTNNNIHTCILP